MKICGVKIRNNEPKPKPKINLDGVWEWQELIRGIAQNHVYYGKKETKPSAVQ